MALSIQSMLIRPTVAYITGKVQGFLAAVNIDATAWQTGDVIHQVLLAFIYTLYTFTGLITSAIRGGYLDTATDPGDSGGDADGPYWLSDLGAGTYGTVREGATFANGVVTFTNASASVTYPIPIGTTVQNSITGKTYRVVDDETNFLAGPYQLAPSVSVDLTVNADEIGTGSNANATEISILSNVLLGVSVSNAAAALGTDVEDADVYRERCREAQVATSPNGPEDGYLYLARTLPGGQPLLRISDGAPVGITRVYVDASKPIGTVDLYYADNDGAADALTGGDVETANANIVAYYDPLTDVFNGQAATNTTINIVGTAKLNSKKAPGVSQSDAEDAIGAALVAYFPTVDIGGLDPTAGAGVIYTIDLRGEAQGAMVGVYDVIITTPAGLTTAILLGHVAVPGTIAITVTVVS